MRLFSFSAVLAFSLFLPATAAPPAKKPAPAVARPAGTQAVQGIVFGIVASGHTGVVHLKTPEGLLKLQYHDSDLVANGAPRREAWAYGAVWKVFYKKDQAVKMIFTGQVDPAVEAADELVRHHYQLLGAKKYARAYKDLGGAWRNQQTQADFVKECQSTKLDWAAKKPPSYNLIVTSASTKQASEVIFVWELHEYYRYTMVKAGKDKWVIDHVDQIQKADYEKA